MHKYTYLNKYVQIIKGGIEKEPAMQYDPRIVCLGPTAAMIADLLGKQG